MTQLGAAFVFSNEDKDRWHFVNVRHEAGEDRRSLQRRITVGPEERLRTASERIAKMRLGAGAARMSALGSRTSTTMHSTSGKVPRSSSTTTRGSTSTYRRDGVYFGACNPIDLVCGASIK